MNRKKLLAALGVALVAVPLLVLGVLAGLNTYLDGKVVTNRPVSFHRAVDAANVLGDVARTPKDEYPAATSRVRGSVPNPRISNNIEAWERDIWNREYSRERMHGKGPTLHKPIDYQYAEKPFTILIVGDSFSYGLFHEITDMNYPRRLEQLLNRSASGSYKIVVLAADQASFLRQSDWITADTIASINPDVVVVTHTMNRLHPTFLENKYCVEFNTCIEDGQDRPFYDEQGHDFARASEKWRIIMCLRADRTPVSTILRKFVYPYFPHVAEAVARNYCTLERVTAGIDLPTERTGAREDAASSPYINDFTTYLDRVKTAVDAQVDPPALHVVNLAWTPDHMWPPLEIDGEPRETYARTLFEMYQQAGFEEIPTPRTRETVARLETWLIGDVGGVGQGTTLNNCVFDCTVDQKQWETNKKTLSAGTINHALKFRPGNTIQAAYARDMFDFIWNRYPQPPSVAPENQPLIVDHMPWAIAVENQANGAQIHRSSQLTERFGRYAENSEPPDHLWGLCARIDHPHAVVALNQERIDRAKGLKVAYNGGAYETVLISFENELADGNTMLRTSVQLKPGQYYILENPQNLRNIYISDPARQCTENISVLEHFDVTVDLVS